MVGLAKLHGIATGGFKAFSGAVAAGGDGVRAATVSWQKAWSGKGCSTHEGGASTSMAC